MSIGFGLNFRGVEFDEPLVGDGRSPDKMCFLFVVVWVGQLDD
jgi:hypothetical protein